MAKDYFRYQMKKRNFSSSILAKELKMSNRHFNRLLVTDGFDIKQTKLILNMFNMTFEDLFCKD